MSAVAALPVPLERDESGALRVAGTRIPLERVLDAYDAGVRPEDIVRQFDVLELADIFAVLSYYLSHADEVAAYRAERARVADAVRSKIESAQPARPGFRDELVSRGRGGGRCCDSRLTRTSTATFYAACSADDLNSKW